MARGDDDAAALGRGLPQPRVELLDELGALAADPGVLEALAHVLDVLLEELRVGQLAGALVAVEQLHLLLELHVVGVVAHVRVYHEDRQVGIDLLVWAVLHDLDDVEAREDRVREAHVVREGDGLVVAALDRVGSRDHAAPRLQLRDDAGLGDRDGLLLHGLVDGGAVVVVHLVELVNEADALIGLHHRSCLQLPLARLQVLLDTCSEAHRRGALSCRIDTAVEDPLDALEELRLGDSGVSEEEQVDIPPGPVHLLLVVLLRSAEEGEGDGLLDLEVAVDGGRDGVVDDVCEVALLGEELELALFYRGELVDLVELDDAVGLDVGAEHRVALLHVQTALVPRRVDARDLRLLSRLQDVHVVPHQHHLLRSRDPARVYVGVRLLDCDLLVVPVDALGPVEREGPAGLAGPAVAEVELAAVGDEVGSLELPTSVALIEGLLELAEHLAAHSHHSLDVDQLADVVHPQLPDAVVDGHLVELDVDLLHDVLEGLRLPREQRVEHCVELGQQVLRLEAEPDGEGAIGLLEVVVADLDGLPVLVEHVAHLAEVEPLGAVDHELGQEADEPALDELLGLVEGDPLVQAALALLRVDELVVVLLVLPLVLLLVVGALPSHLLLVVLLDVLVQVLLRLPPLVPLVQLLLRLPPRLRVQLEVLAVRALGLVAVELLDREMHTGMAS